MTERPCSIYSTADVGWGNTQWGSTPWGGCVVISVLATPPAVRGSHFWSEAFGIQRPAPLALGDHDWWKEK